METTYILDLNGKPFTEKTMSPSNIVSTEHYVATFIEHTGRPRNTFAVGVHDDMLQKPVIGTVGGTAAEPTATNLQTDPNREVAEPDPMLAGKFWGLLPLSIQVILNERAKTDKIIDTLKAYVIMAGADISKKSQRTKYAVYYIAGIYPGLDGQNITDPPMNKTQADQWLNWEEVEEAS